VSRLVDAAHVQDWEAVVAEGPTLHVRRSTVHDTAQREKRGAVSIRAVPKTEAVCLLIGGGRRVPRSPHRFSAAGTVNKQREEDDGHQQGGHQGSAGDARLLQHHFLSRRCKHEFTHC